MPTVVEENGVGPPVNGVNGLVNSVVLTFEYIILYIFYVSLEISLIIIMLFVVLHPQLLRIWSIDAMIAGLALLDIWLARKI